VLSAPDDEANILAINKQGDITMEFDVFRPESGSRLEDNLIPVGILVLTYSDMHQVPVAEIMEAVNYGVTLQKPIEWSTNLKAILSQGKAEYKRVLQRQGLDDRRTRADTALGLANWPVLLWHTRWTFGLCSCRIRYAFLDAMGSGNATFTSMPCQLFREACHIVDMDLKGRRALLLGVSLAELALLTTIQVRRADYDRIIFITDGDQLSEAVLLERIKSVCCDDFKLAVQYCLFMTKGVSV
jgi:hypothetical protein